MNLNYAYNYKYKSEKWSFKNHIVKLNLGKLKIMKI